MANRDYRMEANPDREKMKSLRITVPLKQVIIFKK